MLVVDVMDVYAQFSHGIFDAQAIKDYITHAIECRWAPTTSSWLATISIDYRNYEYPDAISFIPSLYAKRIQVRTSCRSIRSTRISMGTMSWTRAIGRFPVKTSQELSTVVQKTLAYSSQGRTALFTADFHDGPNYSAYSQGFASELPATWQISDAYLEGSYCQLSSARISQMQSTLA